MSLPFLGYTVGREGEMTGVTVWPKPGGRFDMTLLSDDPVAVKKLGVEDKVFVEGGVARFTMVYTAKDVKEFVAGTSPWETGLFFVRDSDDYAALTDFYRERTRVRESGEQPSGDSSTTGNA